MLSGIVVKMGGREWTVPPLTLGQLRQLLPKVHQLSDASAEMDGTHIAILIEIVTAALQRNYPDITSDFVESLVDLGNAGEVLNAVLRGSGLKQRAVSPGEEVAPERRSGASAPILSSTGEISTDF